MDMSTPSLRIFIYTMVLLVVYVFFIFQEKKATGDLQNIKNDITSKTDSSLKNNHETSDNFIISTPIKASQFIDVPNVVDSDTVSQDSSLVPFQSVSLSGIEENPAGIDKNYNTHIEKEKNKQHLKKLTGLIKNITDNDNLNSNTILELWRAAAKSGVPDEALDALKLASQSLDEEVRKLAIQALNDLNNLKENKPNKLEVFAQDLFILDVTQTTDNNYLDNENKNPSSFVQMKANQEKANQLLYLSQYAEDEKVRQAAHDVLISHRLPQAIDMMEQSFARLDENNRVTAVESLWRLAAGNIERERAILLLETAALDTNTDVSEFARHALYDLNNPPEPVEEEALFMVHPEHDNLETAVIK